jgi:CRP-like cAMP-binding protein
VHSVDADAAGETFLTRLSSYVNLTVPEQDCLRRILGPVRQISTHAELLVQGAVSAGPTIVLSGLACQFTLLRNGRRQITAFLLPGDICEFRFLTGGHVEQGVRSLSPALIAAIPVARLTEACEQYPNLVKAMLHAASVQEAVTREWLISLGQRSAVQRMAHLFCELYTRLNVVGLAKGGSFHLPMTQSELGESMGLSTVHVNRTLQELRRDGLIETRDKTVYLLDFPRLASRAMFDPAYLGMLPNHH